MARPIFATVLSAASMLVLSRVGGTLVGTDGRGNKYYRGKRVHTQTHERRWVLYAGEPEATLVPPEWHSWLHHLAKEPPQADNTRRQPWQLPPVPNLTGTDMAYRPPGSTLNAGYRDRATGDYESWTPPQ